MPPIPSHYEETGYLYCKSPVGWLSFVAIGMMKALKQNHESLDPVVWCSNFQEKAANFFRKSYIITMVPCSNPLGSLRQQLAFYLRDLPIVFIIVFWNILIYSISLRVSRKDTQVIAWNQRKSLIVLVESSSLNKTWLILSRYNLKMNSMNLIKNWRIQTRKPVW